MQIHLCKRDVEGVRRAGEEAYPNEGCGFLLGRARGEVRDVERILPAINDRSSTEQRNRYLISAEAFLEGERLARKDELDIIGFYHSHPDAPARPSMYDTEHAWPWYAYIIVSVTDGASEDLRCWVLQDDRVAFVELTVVSED